MHILIAPNAFKNSISASAAAAAIADGLDQSKFNGTYECFPIGDGGDGTGELILRKCKGRLVTTNARDPFRRMMSASYGLINNGKTAVIEMAAASGLRLLKKEKLDPLLATSAGTGDLMKHALDQGVKKIILAMGGSATVDGGSGILSALGLRFLNKNNESLGNLPTKMNELAFIDKTNLDPRISQTEIVILCDVDNRLLGNKGAAAVFGPQKGATTEGVKQLESGLKQLAQVVLQQTGINIADLPFGGTAGGAAAGLHALIDARLERGIDYFLDLTGFHSALRKADMVITGEGSIDEQSLHGKGPVGVAALAKKHNKIVIGLAGQLPSEITSAFKKYFDHLICISPQQLELSQAMAATEENLRNTAVSIGNNIAEFSIRVG